MKNSLQLIGDMHLGSLSIGTPYFEMVVNGFLKNYKKACEYARFCLCVMIQFRLCFILHGYVHV